MSLRRNIKGASKLQGWRLVHGYKTVARKTRKRRKTSRRKK